MIFYFICEKLIINFFIELLFISTNQNNMLSFLFTSACNLCRMNILSAYKVGRKIDQSFDQENDQKVDQKIDQKIYQKIDDKFYEKYGSPQCNGTDDDLYNQNCHDYFDWRK